MSDPMGRGGAQGLPTGAAPGRRWNPDGTDVFCGIDGQPSAVAAPITTTEHFVVIPDLYPVSPGHLLIIPKQHLPCYGAMPAQFEPELMALANRMRHFLRDTYGEPMLWENGVAGQSVHHAHLHLIPMPDSVTALPPAIEGREIRGLAAIRRWFGQGRLYHLMALGNDWRLLPAGSPDVEQAALFKARVLNIPTSGRHWIRTPDAAGMELLRSRFHVWDLTHPVSERSRRSAAAGPGL